MDLREEISIVDPPLIGKYFDAKVNRVLSLLKKGNKDLSAKEIKELIHAQRVELKKIRFILSVIAEYIPGTNFDALYLPFKKVFKKAGAIRELQVNRKQMNKYLPGNRYTEKNEALEKKLTEDYFINKEAYITNINEVIAGVHARISKFPQVSPASFAERLAVRIHTELNSETPEKEFHQSRKGLKALVYSSGLSGEVQHEFNRHMNPVKCKKMECAIGKWHDKKIFSTWLDDEKIRGRKKIKMALEKKMKKASGTIRKLIPRLDKPVNSFSR